ncbi:MAG TPA: nicotinate (nicotinamide) nucleotide adenylyltransferase [Rickettsiales bacterium]|nr:nicotinate (nicotinamide) nucleotide adenylyltransferase [Rickettsiales bacterium]
MKVGLLGGSFDPIHSGHIHIAKLAIKKLGLQQVWLIPTKHNPLKQRASKSYEQRLIACVEFVKNHTKIKVKDFKAHSVVTFELMKRIRQKHPHEDFVWIMGEDNLQNFHLWKRYRELIKLTGFLVMRRGESVSEARGSKVFAIYNKIQKKGKLPRFDLLQSKRADISSSEYRNYKN